ncbi:MAG TPA: helix-turn-helix domain-containing protein, partial [Candidatus Elarobacter sp.]|nr:helix-turn-helix domain-containing protein [Candidatus Elarobacter sp.]
MPEQIQAAFLARVSAERAHEGLLTPLEIRALREALGLTQEALEARLGAGKKSVVRWEAGRVRQSRANDRLLRALRDEQATMAAAASQTFGVDAFAQSVSIVGANAVATSSGSAAQATVPSPKFYPLIMIAPPPSRVASQRPVPYEVSDVEEVSGGRTPSPWSGKRDAPATGSDLVLA